MNVGDQKSFSVRARSFWNDSGIDLAAGGIYQFSARRTWTDFFISCGPAGYSGLSYQNKLGSSLRLPREKWFALCGALDRNGQTAFVIGESCRYTAEAAGRLYCFANDVPGWYWNNFGSAEVIATRLA
ncbi:MULTISPECIES: hypothetical protein [Methylocaldum]|jgi:hypothetical protein|uniref:hypothetical protein n=1 Tax=unclassified Methylocaldum TaxID=2622260 RepID=UPI000A3280CD|nr:hypothetical protein [Methylocaldum sp. RMAD-M]MBP1152583.1 hypothetical protein [Methylocaldum sp. RMAD-M]MDV3242778.1 hypothetical protein [Methylocaldum sp.]MVF22620.1 hypothetical protein [Methylocaldum sp. BRCS4]